MQPVAGGEGGGDGRAGGTAAGGAAAPRPAAAACCSAAAADGAGGADAAPCAAAADGAGGANAAPCADGAGAAGSCTGLQSAPRGRSRGTGEPLSRRCALAKGTARAGVSALQIDACCTCRLLRRPPAPGELARRQVASVKRHQCSRVGSGPPAVASAAAPSSHHLERVY